MLNWNRLPTSIKLVVASVFTIMFLFMGIDLYMKYSIVDILGVLAYTCLVCSMSQHDIVKLRYWGALAGTLFCIQFAIAGLNSNIFGQACLVIYGLYEAYIEGVDKKENN